MKAKHAVVAVSCLLAAACGDPSGNNTNAMQNNENNTSGSNNENNTSGSNNESNTSGSNNAANNPTNNATNNPTNNATNNPTNGNNSLGRALAATADFATSASAWHDVTLDNPALSDNTFGSGDVAVALGESWAYVLDRNGAQVQVLDLDLEDAGIIDVSGVGTTNPFDATDANGSAYISLYNAGEIAVATPNGAGWDQERLDLSSYDGDGNPEPGAMLTDDGFVLVVLQTLENFAGVDSSQLLVIDSADNSVGTPIDLDVTNAQAGLQPMGDNFAVGVTGDFGANDGGILALTKNAAGDYAVSSMLVTEDELGGDLLDFLFVDETTAYAVITLPDFSSQLLAVDLSAGVDVTVVPDVTAPGFGGLALSNSGWLGVGERAMGEEKFVLFDLNGDEVMELPTTLPPSGIVFLR